MRRPEQILSGGICVTSIWDELEAWAESQGLGLVYGSPEVIEVAKAGVDGLRTAGDLDPGFFGKVLDEELRYLEGVSFPVRSVIVLSRPCPGYYVTFTFAEGPLRVPVPPIYGPYALGARDLRQTLLDGALAGSQLARLGAPIKSVASRFGLVTYGRNNITYSPDVGSYQQLIGLVCDLELPASGARLRTVGAPQMAPECEGCEACRKACPTGAISEDRFLLRAERCLSYFSDYGEPWPAWVPPSAPHSLVGCLLCQAACPMNRGRLSYEDLEPAFTVEETVWLLREAETARATPAPEAETTRATPAPEAAAVASPAANPLREAIKAKFQALGLPGGDVVAGRNLAAFLAARRATSTAGGSGR